ASLCGWEEPRLRVQKVWNAEEVALEFRRQLERNLFAVLVAGEYEAAVILHLMQSRWSVDLPDLIDLAAGKGIDPPSYQVAMAVAAADLEWRDLLRRATTELFQTTPGLMAEQYAQYLIEMWKECLDQEFSSLELKQARQGGPPTGPIDREAALKDVYRR